MTKRYLILFVIAILFAGCATNTIPATDLYAINITCDSDQSSVKKNNHTKVLKIATPKSSATIKNRHILYQENEFSLNPYAHSRWSDTPNKMLGSLFLSCINKNTIFRTALPSHSKGRGDYLLESTLLDFHHHINTNGSSDGIVRVEFYLIESKSGTVVATNEFLSKVSSESLNTKGGVKALNTASKNISQRLMQWLLSLDNTITH